jgi:hypothetical protein
LNIRNVHCIQVAWDWLLKCSPFFIYPFAFCLFVELFLAWNLNITKFVTSQNALGHKLSTNKIVIFRLTLLHHKVQQGGFMLNGKSLITRCYKFLTLSYGWLTINCESTIRICKFCYHQQYLPKSLYIGWIGRQVDDIW